MKVLDLGCGNKKVIRPDAEVVGVDVHADCDADVVHDLNRFPYPFPDNTFDEIVCFDVLEHLEDIYSVMREIHRIGKNAPVEIQAPHFSSPYASMDPTHRRAFSVFSFDCLCANRQINPHNFTLDLFLIRKRRIVFPKLTRTVGFLYDKLANAFPLRHEQYMAFIFQAENVRLTLEVLK